MKGTRKNVHSSRLECEVHYTTEVEFETFELIADIP